MRRVEARLAEIDRKYQPLHRQREAQLVKAQKQATTRMWLYFWAIAGQNLAFIYLIYGPLSWDIMEPMTYFFGQSLVIFWWAYFTMASKEFSYESWYQSWVDTYLQRGLVCSPRLSLASGLHSSEGCRRPRVPARIVRTGGRAELGCQGLRAAAGAAGAVLRAAAGAVRRAGHDEDPRRPRAPHPAVLNERSVHEGPLLVPLFSVHNRQLIHSA